MVTVVMALASFFGFFLAYHTYGRWLARRIFQLDPEADVPAKQMEDGVDYVPTRKAVVFGHHFTSIAGTGPIVGPAIAVFWGWLPALLWVVFGAIFIGAVHDFGALIVSMRNRGRTMGEVAGSMINRRARLLFLFVLFLALTVVIGIFGLVIAVIFNLYPSSVLAIWIEIPVALVIGYIMHEKGVDLRLPSLIAIVILYGFVVLGTYWLPIRMPTVIVGGFHVNPVVLWTLILLVYCFIASVLPVWTLLQPRDYINSHQLLVALGMIVLGLFLTRPDLVAPAVNANPPGDAPPIFPFLFITIACGAVSGFHCLVSSGTSSKQLSTEGAAQFVGYGAMVLEGALAVIVILACCAGIGKGVYKNAEPLTYAMAIRDGGMPATAVPQGANMDDPVTGRAAWLLVYGGDWRDMGLGKKVGAFIEGSANMLTGLRIPIRLGIAIVAVLVASFAATTLDTAARLQRYVIQELGRGLDIRSLTKKYTATALAVLAGGGLAMIPGPKGPGSGGLILWPLFGATNQLLAGLSFLVIAFYLLRRNLPLWFVAVPMVLMLVFPAWAMSMQIIAWLTAEEPDYLLAGVAVAIELLQLWMILEAAMLWTKVRGVAPEPLEAGP